ncbi:MAG: histo-blood group system transferase 1 [Actinomycetota bacterium]
MRTTGSVALVVLATGKYLEFVPAMVRSAERHVTGLAAAFVLSDQRPAEMDGLDVRWLPWGHTPWPLSTMVRYRAMTAYADRLVSFRTILHVDADMEFVGAVDLSECQGLFAVRHPLQADRSPADLPFERRCASRAYVAAEEGTVYVAGGVQGGSSPAYLEACATMAEWIQDDLDAGLTPVWHDESIWNRYCITHPPAVVLPVEYCTPDVRRTPDSRILALTKDHDRYRDVPASVRARRRLHRLAMKAKSRAARIVRGTGR